MTMDQWINLLVAVALIVMMLAIGLEMTFGTLLAIVRNGPLVARAALANYIGVPAATIGLLFLFQTQPVVAAGFIVLAACPGAPFGPPLTAIAKGDVLQATGLMIVLAGSSAIIAPILIGGLLPLVSAGTEIRVDTMKIVTTLLATQLLPLFLGVSLRQVKPAIAVRLQPPAKQLSKILNLLAIGLILIVQFDLLIQIRPSSYLGMLTLLVATWVIGGLLGGRELTHRKAMLMTTSLRNISVALVVGTSAFAGTPAVTAIAAYGLVSLFGSLALAVFLGGRTPRSDPTTTAAPG